MISKKEDAFLPDAIEHLALKHLRRYHAMLDLTRIHPENYNVPELYQLIDLWRSIRFKGCVYEKLTPDEQAEVGDAAYDEWESLFEREAAE